MPTKSKFKVTVLAIAVPLGHCSKKLWGFKLLGFIALLKVAVTRVLMATQ